MSTILVLNPNSSMSMTAAMCAGLDPLRRVTAHEILCARIETAPAGIESDADVATVAPLVIALAAATLADAFIVACFSDPGVDGARGAAPAIPVIGIAEAAYYAALQLASSFGVISLAQPSVARHARHIARLGLTSRLAGDRPIDMGVAAAGDSGHAQGSVTEAGRRLRDEDGAGVVILGCAGMGVHRLRLQGRPRPAGDRPRSGSGRRGHDGSGSSIRVWDMSKTDLLLRGSIVTPRGLLHGGWIAVGGGTIAAVGPAGVAPPKAARVEDLGDRLILPGVVDGQTHATSYKGLDGIADTTRSAIAGGVTTLVDMPYDNPLPLDRPERLTAKTAAIAAHSHADMALYGTVTRETGVAHVPALIAGGVAAFKISSFESSPTRFPRIGADLMLDLFEVIAPTGVPLGLHNEDQEIVLARIAAARAAGRDGIEAHSEARPLAAELAATAQFIALAQASGSHAHPVHLSSKSGFDLVHAFAGFGTRATGETCVHYLWFDAARDGVRLGARMKVNPPIRSGEIDGLWQAIADGRVAFTSSDHSSWPLDGKLTPSIFEAGAGVPGLETLLPAFFTAAGLRGFNAAALTAAQLSERPARFFGLSGKGAIAAGKDADFVVLESGSFDWDEARAHDGLRWSPFHGETFAAKVAATYLRGELVWDGTDIINTAGSGRYITRGRSRWHDNERSP